VNQPPVVCRQGASLELLTLADTCLLWGHRLSEWCGHGPALEEDIALTNTALDVIGQARALLQLAASRGEEEATETTEDGLAYFREPHDFHNLMIAALPNGDYAQTIARSFLLAAWFVPVWESLATGVDKPLAAIAANAVKESRMQLRHASDWVIRFGDGTSQSRQRITAAFAALWPYCDEMMQASIFNTQQASREAHWRDTVGDTFDRATLGAPEKFFSPPSVALTLAAQENRAALLNEMQSLARQHPGARW
jgi:ring-1,2-phenylacetyl-CoA epoxidase subunit PaaC